MSHDACFKIFPIDRAMLETDTLRNALLLRCGIGRVRDNLASQWLWALFMFTCMSSLSSVMLITSSASSGNETSGGAAPVLDRHHQNDFSYIILNSCALPSFWNLR